MASMVEMFSISFENNSLPIDAMMISMESARSVVRYIDRA